MDCLHVCFVIAILFSNIFSFCQSSEQYHSNDGKINNYKFIIETPLYSCDILGNVCDTAPIQVAEPGAVYTIIGTTKTDSLIIRFWKWKENPAINFTLCYADSLGIKRKYFLVPYSVIKEKSIPRYDRKACFTAGTVLIPIKLRLKKFDFSKDITLGPVAGVKFRLSNFEQNFFSILAGLGITSITLDSRSTDGKVEEAIEVPALTPSLGFVFDFFNSTQAGLFVGWDFISNNENLHLIYYGKLWISFGLGFSILTKGGNTSTTEEER